jgi:predicted PurR-regulated permease PerM
MSPSAAPPRRRANGWSSSDILRAVALAVGAFYALRLLYTASPIILVGFLGLLLGLSLGHFAERLQKRRIPRAVTAVGVVLLVYGTMIGSGVLLAPLMREQVSALQEKLPQAIDYIEAQIERVNGVFGPTTREADGGAVPREGQAGRETPPPGTRGAGTAPTPDAQGAVADRPPLRQQLADRLSGLTGFIGPFLSSTASVLAAIFIITFVAIYIAIDPDTYREGTLHLLPHRHRQRAREVMQEMGYVLRRWLATQFIAMVSIGVVTTVGLLVIGIDAPFALGALAGLLEFVPYAGPVIASIPAIAIALVDSPEKALVTALFYLGIQQLESTVLTPLLMKNTLELPPILTIMTQGIMGLLFGLIGVLVAVPMLAAVIVVVKRLYVEDVVGDDLDAAEPDEQPA